MSFTQSYSNFFKRWFPSPFTIAILLTLLTFVIAFFFTNTVGSASYISDLGVFWFEGIFDKGLLAFTVQMMLILVLGHILALSKPAQKLIDVALDYCTDTASSAAIVALLTIMVSLFNWGLGLIFGAIFARKIGEHFVKQGKKLNYALVGAAAYVGLMVWHGGLSGSAPLTVAGSEHSLVNEIGSIPLAETVFSTMNLTVSVLLLIVIPFVMYFVGRRNEGQVPDIQLERTKNNQQEIDSDTTPAEQLESNSVVGIILGVLMLILFFYLAFLKIQSGGRFWSILYLNSTNLLLLALALIFHANLKSFLNALEESIGDVSGILIQFPLYFGIMAVMKESGLVNMIADSMTRSSSDFTLPIFTYLSSGLVNIFVPSGGGQWQIQGPIIAQTALQTGTSIPKLVMALAYGDQLTNMLQPFWALPLLGITGLKAKDILPYTLLLFLLGFVIFLLGLIIF